MAAPKRTIKPKKRGKFNNTRCETSDGAKHASKKEAARWLFLLEQQAKGIISHLRRQVRYDLHVNGIKIGGCIPDFQYIVCETGMQITEDVKSWASMTPLYRRNKKHLAAEHNINMVEVFEPSTVLW